VETARSEKDSPSDMQNLKADLTSVKDDLKEITRSLAERGKERARVLKEKLAHAAEVATDKTRKCVEEHPLASVGVAFGAGVVLGAVLVAVLKRNR
jgi:ElaB/YqjD/DUF883 family membrane-anchored ribosome-binding protein